MNKRDLTTSTIGIIIVFALIAMLSYFAINGVQIDKEIGKLYQPKIDIHNIFEI